MGAGVSLTLLPALGSLSPIELPCPDSSWELLPCLIVSCFVLFGSPLGVLHFSEEKWIEIGSGEEERLVRVRKSGRRGNYSWDILFERRI